MPRRIKMSGTVIAVSILSGIVAFFIIAHFYPPLNRFLYGGEFEIPLKDIQFWVEKIPERNYYRVHAKYKKSPETIMWWGHSVSFTDSRGVFGGDPIFFNPENNKIYGGGWSGLQGDLTGVQKIEPGERVCYYLCEGKIEKEAFKPIFPQGTKFTFMQGGFGIFGITDASRYYIKIYFPGTLKKVTKEELEKGVLAEIVEDTTKKKE